jgi:hypothetical protein
VALLITPEGNAQAAPAEPAVREDRLPDKAVRIPLTGSLWVFGQLSRGPDGTAFPDAQLMGGTGLAYELTLGRGAALWLGCGPELTYLDAPRPGRGLESPLLPGRPQWLHLNVQLRWPLLGPVGLECQGSATPALNWGDHESLDQDLRLVCPLGKGGQLRLGARHYWETSGEAQPGAEGTQVYAGIRLAW